MQGWDSLQAAVDASVRDEKALPLFQKAFEKFQEVSASGAAPAMLCIISAPGCLAAPLLCMHAVLARFQLCEG